MIKISWKTKENYCNTTVLKNAYNQYSKFDAYIQYSKLWISRSSHPEVSLEKGVLKICSKFIGELPCWSVISVKLLCNFIEITLRYGCSPVDLLHIFRTPFPKNTSDGLFLIFHIFKDFSDSYKNVNITWSVYLLFFEIWHFKHQFHKMIKRTQTIRRQIGDELFECVWPFCGIGA